MYFNVSWAEGLSVGGNGGTHVFQRYVREHRHGDSEAEGEGGDEGRGEETAPVTHPTSL